MSKIIPKIKTKHIGVVTTSSSIDCLDDEKIETGYQYWRNKGWKITESPICRKKRYYMSGTIEARVEAIHSFVLDSSIDVIMSFWGGTNTNQILRYLDYSLIRKNPKVFVGYSDTSSLLLAINKQSNLVTYHGPSVITYAKPNLDEYNFEYFNRALTEKEWKINEPQSFADDLYFLRKENADRRILQKNIGTKVFRKGQSFGISLASNLQTMLVLSGTEYFPDISGKILFIEEAEDENIQMIDRFFTQLSMIPDFKNIKGLVIGKFMKNSGVKENYLKSILEEISHFCNCPIIYDASFGHTDPIFTIPNGIRCDINTELKSPIMFSYD